MTPGLELGNNFCANSDDSLQTLYPTLKPMTHKDESYESSHNDSFRRVLSYVIGG